MLTPDARRLQAVAAAFAPPVASKPRVVSLGGGGTAVPVPSVPAAPLPAAAAAAAGKGDDGATAADATETVKVSSFSAR